MFFFFFFFFFSILYNALYYIYIKKRKTLLLYYFMYGYGITSLLINNTYKILIIILYILSKLRTSLSYL
jgi:hypothetical protein